MPTQQIHNSHTDERTEHLLEQDAELEALRQDHDTTTYQPYPDHAHGLITNATVVDAEDVDSDFLDYHGRLSDEGEYEEPTESDVILGKAVNVDSNYAEKFIELEVVLHTESLATVYVPWTPDELFLEKLQSHTGTDSLYEMQSDVIPLEQEFDDVYTIPYNHPNTETNPLVRLAITSITMSLIPVLLGIGLGFGLFVGAFVLSILGLVEYVTYVQNEHWRKLPENPRVFEIARLEMDR